MQLHLLQFILSIFNWCVKVSFISHSKAEPKIRFVAILWPDNATESDSLKPTRGDRGGHDHLYPSTLMEVERCDPDPALLADLLI